MRHTNLDVRIDPAVSPAEDAQFRLRPGLTGTGTDSNETVPEPARPGRSRNWASGPVMFWSIRSGARSSRERIRPEAGARAALLRR